MSGFQGPPQQGNVVPFQPQQAPAMVPNPAFQQWLQLKQQVDAANAENQSRQQQFDAAVALIKQDGLRGFRLDIQADSTIAPDEQAEKQSRIEFMQQFVPLMEQAIPIAQGNPDIADMLKEVVLFAVRGFPVARPVEAPIEKAFDAIGKMPPNPKVSGQQQKGPQQNPQIEAAKVQADVHDTQMRSQSETQAASLKAQTDQMAIAQKQQQAVLQAQTAAQKTAAEEQRSQAEMAMQVAELQQRERLESAKMTHMAARDAGRLV